MSTNGFYYDGKTSTRKEVTLSLNDGILHLRGDGLCQDLSLQEVRVSDPLGSTRRSLYFENGGKCEIEDGPFAQRLCRAQGTGGFFRGVHRWERSLRRALIALAVTAGLAWSFVHFGIPWLAERAAFALPPATEAALERETLKILDRTLLTPSHVSEERQGALGSLFAEVAADLGDERSYNLVFRASSRLGANALALPAGTIILTDELEALAESDEEIAAIFAHEVGHIRYRHALRHLLQNSAAGLLVSTLTGDLFSASSLAATLPTVLVDAKFSREMEREADEVAIDYLQRKGIAPERYAAILERLENAHGAGQEERASLLDVFSTHPSTRERLETIEQTTNPSTPQ